MAIRILRAEALLVFLVAQMPFAANANSMRCKLVQVMELTVDGSLQENSLASLYAQNDLVVDLATGVIYHPGFGNESYPNKTVLDAGSRSSSFKMLASSIPGPASDFENAVFVNTVFLQIDTWVETPEKPFIVVESQNVGTGVCQ
jgi:hypothetical protein